MNRRNFFKGVLGTLAVCVVGKLVPSKVSKLYQWWKGAYSGTHFEVDGAKLLEARIKAVCHHNGVPYRMFVCKDFDKQVNSVELEDYKLRLKRYIAITGHNLEVVDVTNCD